MYRRPYVESSVFVAYIRGEIRNGHDCKAVFDSILEAAIAGDFRIFTSSLTIAEVFKNKRDGVQLTAQENEDLRPYFRGDYIRLIEVDRDIAERANELCRTHLASPEVPALRPNDAIHIASAERAECEVVLAYDHHFTRQKHSSMRIEWPQMLALFTMPGSYLIEAAAPAVQLELAPPKSGDSTANESAQPRELPRLVPLNSEVQPDSNQPNEDQTALAIPADTAGEPSVQKEKESDPFKAPDSSNAVIKDPENP